jgi:hypothetical protein
MCVAGFNRCVWIMDDGDLAWDIVRQGLCGPAVGPVVQS